MPVWKLLGLGLVGVLAAMRWWAERMASPVDVRAPAGSIDSTSRVHTQEHAHALLADVRRVMERHGISCGRMPIRVRVAILNVEGITVRRQL